MHRGLHGLTDECCGKIDLYQVQNRVVHILSCRKCCQRQRSYFMKDFWLFWHQKFDSTSNRTHLIQFWITKPGTCQFLDDTHQWSYIIYSSIECWCELTSVWLSFNMTTHLSHLSKLWARFIIFDMTFSTEVCSSNKSCTTSSSA